METEENQKLKFGMFIVDSFFAQTEKCQVNIFNLTKRLRAEKRGE